MADPPALGPVSAGPVRATQASLHGSIDPGGLSTTYSFEYSTDADFSNADLSPAEIVAPTFEGDPVEEAAASGEATGLEPNRTYFYRLVASNSDGSVDGDYAAGTAATFTTRPGGFYLLPGDDGFAAGAVHVRGGQHAIQEALKNHTPVTTEVAHEAGEHPYAVSFHLALNEAGAERLRFEIPTGLIYNPQAAICASAVFATPRIESAPTGGSMSGESCAGNSQVGTVRVETGHGQRTFGVFNLDPARGTLARLGAAPYGSHLTFGVSLQQRPNGGYALVLQSSQVPEDLQLFGLDLTLWGTPGEALRNRERGDCLNEVSPERWECLEIGSPPRAQLSLPPGCPGPLAFEVGVEGTSGAALTAAAVNEDEEGHPVAEVCQQPFSPALTADFDNTRASSPSGFAFWLGTELSDMTNPAARSPAPARRLVVRLPAGATLNPSAGANLGACTPAQFAIEQSVDTGRPGCPPNSRIGTLRLESPLLAQRVFGSVYLATPDDPATSAPGAENPFDTLVSFYLVAKVPLRGIAMTAVGQLQLDPQTGSLTAIVDDLPQLPFEKLEVLFRSGLRSFLITPPHCGFVPVGVEATPWGDAATLVETSLTWIKTGASGEGCPADVPPFHPTVTSGAVNSNVNSFTPYLVHISRTDEEQEISAYSLLLPKGVTGKLAGIPLCPDSAIEAARRLRAREAAEQTACSPASRVGHLFAGFGVGSALTYSEGSLYLAGPFNGAPLSMVAIVPAAIGPFDLGAIVYRTGFRIDPQTAQLRVDAAASDTFPYIRDIVALHLRDIRVYFDRREFTHNPSSCAASELTSTLAGAGENPVDTADDSLAQASSFFQLLNCRSLGFRPRLGARLLGPIRRGGFPRLRMTFTSRGATDSNLKGISVVIPRQEFLAQEHIREICTQVQFRQESCPAKSVYGSAVADTPLLDQPLKGPVYLRSSDGALPDLVADLRSGSVRIIISGKIGPGRHGGIRASFGDLPDEPLNTFVMNLYGGRRGLLVNSADICRTPPIADVKAIGQNDVGARFTTFVRGKCGRKKAAIGGRGKKPTKTGKHRGR